VQQQIAIAAAVSQGKYQASTQAATLHPAGQSAAAIKRELRIRMKNV
jgi:uncharacterized membrane protein YciS (DUF1049 family)